VDQKGALRGNSPAKIDDKGRLKVPSLFRDFMDANGPEAFVTSITGACVLIYPMAVWVEKERKLAAAPSTLPARNRFLRAVNYFGQTAEIDKQARVLIHPLLRESAQMNGEVEVLGQYDHLEIWNHERFVAEREPVSVDDLQVLAQYGI
jgi:MraZ protein